MSNCITYKVIYILDLRFTTKHSTNTKMPPNGKPSKTIPELKLGDILISRCV